jgi:DNA-binding transcriptional MerR regulator
MKKGTAKSYRVKEFAGLTKVTVRALHHYDHIGLLKPSGRTESGYRIYTEQDLLRLQQIVTLKFMGFPLERIKAILARPNFAVRKALAIQIEAIDEEIERLRRASKALRQMAEALDRGGRVDWKKVINIMEAIHMSDEAKKEWTKKFFTEADMKEFEEIGKKYTPETMQNYQNKWAALIAEVEKNLSVDPGGSLAQSLAERWTALLNEGYGGHEGLLAKIGKANQEAMRTGHHQATPTGKPPFDQKVWEFIQKANAARKAK